MEDQLARSIADTHWRINRAAAIENNIFESEAWNQETWVAGKAAERGAESSWDEVSRALAIIRSFLDQPKRFHLLTTYEMRLLRKAQIEMKRLPPRPPRKPMNPQLSAAPMASFFQATPRRNKSKHSSTPSLPD